MTDDRELREYEHDSALGRNDSRAIEGPLLEGRNKVPPQVKRPTPPPAPPVPPTRQQK